MYYKGLPCGRGIKNSTRQEIRVQSLGLEDPLEKEMPTTPVSLPGKFHGQRLVGCSLWASQKTRQNLATKQQQQLSEIQFGNSQMLVGDGQGSLACCSPWGCKESDTTERLNWTEAESVIGLQPWSLSSYRFSTMAPYMYSQIRTMLHEQPRTETSLEMANYLDAMTAQSGPWTVTGIFKRWAPLSEQHSAHFILAWLPSVLQWVKQHIQWKSGGFLIHL